MKISFFDNYILIEGIEDFDIKQSCECGQCFRFREIEGVLGAEHEGHVLGMFGNVLGVKEDGFSDETGGEEAGRGKNKGVSGSNAVFEALEPLANPTTASGPPPFSKGGKNPPPASPVSPFRQGGHCTSYSVVAGGRHVVLRQPERGVLILENTTKEAFEEIWRKYFDLDRDYGGIKKSFEKDEVLSAAAKHGWGILVFKQDIWETLVSFIISQNNNIPRIKGIIEKLCVNFGKEVRTKDYTYYSFPTPKDLAGRSEEDLAVLRAGYRTKYILDAAKKVAGGEVDIYGLEGLSYNEAKKEIMKIKGVGAKVADCTLLFGAGKLEAFPVDVWVRRMLSGFYGEKYDVGNFGEYAGIAQQYLFHYAREKKIKN